MSIAALSDIVIRKFIPKVDAGACLPTEPCGSCVFWYRGCSGSGCYSFYRWSMKTDCYGRCTLTGYIRCKAVRTGMCSSTCN